MLFGAGAGALVAPSMVWPFRKIFLPTSVPNFWGGHPLPDELFVDTPLLQKLNRITDVQMEIFRKEIPRMVEVGHQFRYLFIGPSGVITLPTPLQIPLNLERNHETKIGAAHFNDLLALPKL